MSPNAKNSFVVLQAHLDPFTTTLFDVSYFTNLQLHLHPADAEKLPILRGAACKIYYTQGKGELPHGSEWPRLVKSSLGKNHLDRHLFGEPKLCSARYLGDGLVQLHSNHSQQMGGSRQRSAAKQFTLCRKFFVLSSQVPGDTTYPKANCSVPRCRLGT